MATLTTQTTWHNNPRPTLAYASTAYVNSVTSPYYKDDRSVPTYVSDVTPSVLVLAATVGTSVPFLNVAVGLTPTGVWSAKTTIAFKVESIPAGTPETSTIKLPNNVNNTDIAETIIRLVNKNTGNANNISAKKPDAGFEALGSMLIQRLDGPPTDAAWNGSFTLTSVTITPPTP